MRVATDIGGTFTDLVCFEYKGGQVTKVVIAKAHTTPPGFENGIIDAIEKARLLPENFNFFAHGTTTVINAITERKGAKVALITTKGFRDVLEIGRGNRPDLFNFNFKKPEAFIPRFLRFEAIERITYKGEVQEQLDEPALEKVISLLKKEDIEAIAICFLHAFKNPLHEQRATDLIKKWWPEIEVVASHHICREWREYERTNTTVLSAYVKGVTKTYLDQLSLELKQRGLRKLPFIMQSNGGITTMENAKENPVSIIESGPAGGVLGCAALGKLINEPDLIVLDIGGTTAKCSLIENFQVKVTTSYHIEKSRTNPGYPLLTPVIDIVEIGNGGGSIAWIDAGGKMHVGPKSAGSEPGPSAYGKGGINVTTTDANLLLGRIHPGFFLGGEKGPDWVALSKAFKPMMQSLNLGMMEVARGIVRIANNNMVNALKLVSINKGHDPRDFTLITIGGGGAMHAVELAIELKIKKVIVPAYSGVFSALGMLLTDLRRDLIRTNVFNLESTHLFRLEQLYLEMQEECADQFNRDGFGSDLLQFEWFADLRYSNQEHVVKVKIEAGALNESVLQEIICSFHLAHEKQYSYSLQNAVEVVNQHIVATVSVGDKTLPEEPKQNLNSFYGKQIVDFGALGIHRALVYRKDFLSADERILGPALIVENTTSTVLPPGYSLVKDRFGNLIITAIN